MGVLYVVDSVTRQWLEQARKAGQALGPSASDGTFAAGVNHVTELLPVLMGDIISVAPEDQKVRQIEDVVQVDCTVRSPHRIQLHSYPIVQYLLGSFSSPYAIISETHVLFSASFRQRSKNLSRYGRGAIPSLLVC